MSRPLAGARNGRGRLLGAAIDSLDGHLADAQGDVDWRSSAGVVRLRHDVQHDR